MTISANAGRQEVISASVAIDLTDATLVSGTAQNAIQLPPNAYVVGGQVDTTTAFDSATTDVADVVIGSESLLATGDIAALGSLSLSGNAIKANTPSWVTFEWTGAGAAPSEGTVRLTVQYVVDGRACFSEG